MCWNADISINTFLFGMLSLFFIYFVNTFTKYKMKIFENPFMYFIIFSFVIMQLIEFFLWKNLKNKRANMVFSILGFIILMIQPVILMLYDTYESGNITQFIKIFSLYSIGWIGFLLYKYFYNPIDLITTIGKYGHLSWNWLHFKKLEGIIYIFLYFSYIVYSFLYLSKNIDVFYKYLFFITAILSKFLYYNTGEFGSLWCWVINMYLLILLVNILLVKPFYEYNGLC